LLAYVVRAITPGEFTYPALVVEDMYEPETIGPHRIGKLSVQDAVKFFSTAYKSLSPFRGEREGPIARRWEGEVGPFGKRSGIPHLTPTLSAPGGGEGVLRRKLGRKAMLLGVAIFVLLPASAYLAPPRPRGRPQPRRLDAGSWRATGRSCAGF